MNAAGMAPCPRTSDAVGWALHALEPDEEQAVVTHLPSCPSCRAAVQEAEIVLSGLGAAVEQVEPPASLRERILSTATATPQRPEVLRPRSSPENDPATRPESPPVAAEEGGKRRHRMDEQAPARRSWLSTRRRALVAASVALVGVLTVGGLAARTVQLEQQRDAAISQAQSVADLMGQLDEPGTSHAVLASADGTPVGAVLVGEEQRRLVTVGLPANAVDRETYVLWGVRNGTPVAIGTFDVGQDDPGSGTLRSPSEAAGFSNYAISLEPGRSAPAAPSEVIADGQVET